MGKFILALRIEGDASLYIYYICLYSPSVLVSITLAHWREGGKKAQFKTLIENVSYSFHSCDFQFVWGEMSHSLGFTSFWENPARAHLELISGYGPGC